MPNTALLIIDMLNDFILDDAPLRVPGGREIVSCIAAEIERARRTGIPVIYLCDSHTEDDPELEVWPRHAMKGTPGAEVIAELTPEPSDVVIPKTRYSSFFRTDLEHRLESLRVKRLILTGVCTEICILHTAADAIMRGFVVEAPEGCTAGLSPEGHEFALRQIREILQPSKG